MGSVPLAGTKVELKELRNRHYGQMVWVVGSDASVNFFPDDFWSHRAVIGVNAVPRHIPVRYCVTKADGSGGWVQAQANDLPDVLHVVSKHPNGDEWRGDSGVSGPNVVTFDHGENKCERFDAARDIPDEPNRLLVSWSTLGSAMHFAAYLGARTVFMVGVSGGSFGNATNLPDYNPNGAGPIEGMSKQTQAIADRLQQMYGTEFVTVLPWANLRCGGTKFRSDYGRLNDA